MTTSQRTHHQLHLVTWAMSYQQATETHVGGATCRRETRRWRHPVAGRRVPRSCAARRCPCWRSGRWEPCSAVRSGERDWTPATRSTRPEHGVHTVNSLPTRRAHRDGAERPVNTRPPHPRGALPQPPTPPLAPPPPPLTWMSLCGFQSMS